MTYRVRPADLIAFDGQSLALAPDLFNRAATTNYPYKMMATGVTGTGWEIVAISSTTWLEREVDVAGRVDALLTTISGRATLIDCGGTRNINQGQSAADMFTEASGYWSDRRAAGWDNIIALTVTPSTQYTGGEPAVVTAFNQMLRDAVGVELEAVADLDTIPELADPTDTTYYSDGLHYTSAATTLIAPVARAAYVSVVPQ